MFKWLGGITDRIFAVIGAITFAQFPLFMQQYTQQLVGRESELRMQVDAMRHAASLSGKTIEQLIQKFITNEDVDFVHQGEVMQSIVSRWHHLADALSGMQDASLWKRPIAFLYDLNTETFSSTFHHFKMGLPLNLEGGVYGLIGIAFGCLAFAFFRSIWGKFRNICSHIWMQLKIKKKAA